MNKLKILMCSEASFLSSGFSIYAKEILSRLHNTNKYEIAEFASYGLVNDPRDKSIPNGSIMLMLCRIMILDIKNILQEQIISLEDGDLKKFY